jgi:hypothetical protein
MKILSQKKLILTGAILGGAYGIFARFIFGFGLVGDFFEVMSLSFIFGVPLSLGFIAVWFGPYRETRKVVDLILVPWLASLTCLACALALVWEGLICVIIWLPLVIIVSLVGGLFAGLLLAIFVSKRDRNYCLVIVAIFPFAIAPLEHLHAVSSQVTDVPTQIKVHASPETVWKQIRSVPLISEHEQSYSFSHMMGFPRPLEAKLVGEGVGAVRYATFEHGVLFVETINEWDEPHRLSFSIRADTKNIPPTTFDEHVIIGGKYFDVLSGTYSIEDIGHGDVILHLSSEQRLSTRFNFYSHFWTEYLMSDLQNYILRIIKNRCEQQV